MNVYDFKTMVGGWFVGNFSPSAFKTESVEVSYKKHPKNEKWDIHYHKQATEINLLVKGKMLMHDTELNEGNIFVLHPFEISNPVFLEDCEIVCVKLPGKINDKFKI